MHVSKYSRSSLSNLFLLQVNRLFALKKMRLTIECYAKIFFHYPHHHQPINVLTTGAQAFVMDYPQGERTIAHHARPCVVGYGPSNSLKTYLDVFR
jgi:hypothetical protein